MRSQLMTVDEGSAASVSQGRTSEYMGALSLIAGAFSSGGKLLVCGNGGSAADSSHIAGELVKSFEGKRTLDKVAVSSLILAGEERGKKLAGLLEAGLPAISLAADGAVMSAISNDIGPGAIFAQQVMALGFAGDVLLCISTSGESENVINAAITAKAKGMAVIGLMGPDTSTLSKYCDVSLLAQGRSTAQIQSAHQVLYHDLCKDLEAWLIDGAGQRAE